MTKKKTKKTRSKKNDYNKNMLVSTTIFAILGTLVYLALLYFIYPSYVNWTNSISFFVVVWIIYYFVGKRKYENYGKK